MIKTHVRQDGILVWLQHKHYADSFLLTGDKTLQEIEDTVKRTDLRLRRMAKV